MSAKAILFGSIGTLVETSEIQRQAFNQAFQEADLDWNWGVEEYKELLSASGGRQRISTYAKSRDEVVDAEGLHARKTQIFDEKIAHEGLSLRLGVADVIQYAKQNDVKLAFVTSTSRDNIDAVFAAVSGQISAADFDFVGDASMISNSKPDPEIYELALERLGLTADVCTAVEDTPVSSKSATAAGIRCIGFPGDYADANGFNDTVKTVSKLSVDELLKLN